MTDRNLIKQLKSLKEIKPREEWVVLTKENLFKEESKGISLISALLDTIKELQKGERFVFNHKPAFAFALTAVIFVGLFGFAQGSMPGDSLFALKKITEKGQAVLVSERNKAKYDLEMVNRRLDDLVEVAQSNAGKNLGAAINEYRQTASNAAKSLAKSNDIKEIAAEVRKLEEKEEQIRSLGVEMGGLTDLDNALLNVVEREITYFEDKELSEDDKDVLNEAKVYYEEGRYSEALEKLMIIGK